MAVALQHTAGSAGRQLVGKFHLEQCQSGGDVVLHFRNDHHGSVVGAASGDEHPTLERHLKRERDLRTSEDASDNVLFLKNSVVRFLCAKDDKEMQDMLGAMASILSLAPHEVEAIEAAAAKPGLVSRILDAEIRVPFFGR